MARDPEEDCAHCGVELDLINISSTDDLCEDCCKKWLAALRERDQDSVSWK